MHAWAPAKQLSSGRLVAAPDNAFIDVTEHEVRTDVRGDMFDVESKYSTEDGPCLWGIVCHIEPVHELGLETLFGARIEVGMVITDDWGDTERKALANINKEGVVMSGISPSSGPVYTYGELLKNERARLIILVEPNEHSITMSWTNHDGHKFQETMSHLCWSGFRPYVQISGAASVQLVSI